MDSGFDGVDAPGAENPNVYLIIGYSSGAFPWGYCALGLNGLSSSRVGLWVLESYLSLVSCTLRISYDSARSLNFCGSPPASGWWILDSLM